MATSTDGVRAHDILLGYEPLSKHGYCWYYVWQAYAAAGASTSMGSTPTAYAAWNVTSGRHPGDRNPPHGAAIWLGRRYSDGNLDGDVFIAGAYDGDHAATDQPGWGQTGTTSIQGRMNLTGREYLGWTDHVLDCPITTGGDGDMNDAQANQLQQIYNAIFSGGPSMPDGGRSLGQSIAEIATGGRPFVSRDDVYPVTADDIIRGGLNGWIQELADCKTLLLALTDRLDALEAEEPPRGNGK
jgi:hypothetical protein